MLQSAREHPLAMLAAGMCMGAASVLLLQRAAAEEKQERNDHFKKHVLQERSSMRSPEMPTRKPSRKRSFSFERPKAIVVVDPLSTGLLLAKLLSDRGYAVICVMSRKFDKDMLEFVPHNIGKVEFERTFVYDGDLNALVKKLRAIQAVTIDGFMVGCECGVALHDHLTERWGTVPSNGTKGTAARRNKYLMGEAVRDAGVRAAKQEEVAEEGFEGVKRFIDGVKNPRTGEFSIVLKPVSSAGSEGVSFAHNVQEAKEAYDHIFGEKNVFGEDNTSVLCQEFLQGTEYVVDCVSVNGVHKCVAIWEYDKRPCNGAQFVYFGMRLYESETGEREEALVQYMFKVLDALNVRHGPSHGEVMWTATGPCLIEVGSRPHGGDGTFVEMTREPIGYNQLSVMIDAHVNEKLFEKFPTRPGKLNAHCMEVCMVARQDGLLLGFPRMREIELLPSYRMSEIKVAIGGQITRTVDFLTSPGAILLCHRDKEVMEADCRKIEELELDGLYEIRRLRHLSSHSDASILALAT